MQAQQAQTEGACLRYPTDLGIHATVTYEIAVSMLQRAITMSAGTPYVWSYIDKPPDGQVYLLGISPNASFPNDGVRYQEPESRVVIPVPNRGPNPEAFENELEICEVKYGFVPGSLESMASRVRRRFRLQKGGHPNVVLVHYSRAQPIPINPALNTPIRSYPLRPINEPSVFVLGPKAGRKAYPMAEATTHFNPSLQGGPTHMNNPQAMIAQQNMQLEALERRRAREMDRERGGAMGNMGGPTRPGGQGPPSGAAMPRGPAVIDDDNSGDESEFISTRTIAETRYKRNHELMNDVFRFASASDSAKQDVIKQSNVAPFSAQFSLKELETKCAKLESEIEVLRANAEERKATRLRKENDAPETV